MYLLQCTPASVVEILKFFRIVLPKSLAWKDIASKPSEALVSLRSETASAFAAEQSPTSKKPAYQQDQAARCKIDTFCQKNDADLSARLLYHHCFLERKFSIFVGFNPIENFWFPVILYFEMCNFDLGDVHICR